MTVRGFCWRSTNWSKRCIFSLRTSKYTCLPLGLLWIWYLEEIVCLQVPTCSINNEHFHVGVYVKLGQFCSTILTKTQYFVNKEEITSLPIVWAWGCLCDLISLSTSRSKYKKSEYWRTTWDKLGSKITYLRLLKAPKLWRVHSQKIPPI